MDTHSVWLAFSLTLLAGLSTGIGAVLSLVFKETNTRFLSLALGFSAGVMIYVSFAEILVKARIALTGHWGNVFGSWMTVAAFFGGIALIAFIDTLVPSGNNPHEVPPQSVIDAVAAEAEGNAPTANGVSPPDRSRLHRTGVFTAIVIAIHNFPEGLATFTAALSDPALGVAIAGAIAIHNIPEGIAVAVPIFYATGNRKTAFLHSFLSGLAEPLGALVGYLILLPFFSPAVFGILFAGVAGIMVFISLDELLPAAEEYGEHHLCIYGVVGGMALMAVSLLLFL